MPEMEMADMEAQFKARMDAHAKALEKALSDEFLEKKRKAEQELEVEIELKREKRMRELEEEIKEEVDAKQAKLASLDAQLSERMLLVSEEQTLLDDLKQKAHEMQCKLDEESRKSMNAMGREPPTHAVFPVPCTRVSDPKSAMKEKLREKLEETQRENQVGMKDVSQSTPSPTGSAPAHTPSPSTVASAPDGVIVPVTDMRFSSSTHPAAWQFLYRLTRREDQCDKTIYDAWHAGAVFVDQIVFESLIPSHTKSWSW